MYDNARTAAMNDNSRRPLLPADERERRESHERWTWCAAVTSAVALLGGIAAIVVGIVAINLAGMSSTPSPAPAPSPSSTVHETLPLRPEDVLASSDVPANGTHTCDYIVVGSGPGGAPFAAHVARRFPALTVCLFEQGVDELAQTGAACAVNASTGHVADPATCRDWAQGNKVVFGGQVVDGCMLARFEEQSSDSQRDDRVPTNGVRGIQLGGTSAVNAQIYLRGTKKGTWDRMEAATGSAEWSFDAAVAADNAITNRAYTRIVDDLPSPLLPGFLGGSVGGSPIFRGDVDAGTFRYFDPALYSDGANELPITMVPRADSFAQAVSRAVLAALPNRFANELNFSYSPSDITQVPWVNIEDPAYDEIVTTVPFSMTDSSKAFWRLLVAASTGVDGLAGVLPNAVEFFKFAASTPSPGATLVDYVRFVLNVTSVPELTKQIGFVPLMTVASTGEFTNVLEPFAGVFGNGALLPIVGSTRTPAHAAFLYPLLGKGATPAPPASNLVVVENALVTRVLFADDDETRVIGIEYLPNGREATVPLGYGDNGECNEQTHAAARAAARAATPLRAYARYEVVLSAGAYVTPTLLQRSGIGAREDLEPIGIKTRVELPGVGRLLNHPDLQLFYESAAAPSAISQFSALQDGQVPTLVRLRSSPGLEYADMHALFGSPISLNIESDRLLYAVLGNTTPIVAPLTNDVRQHPSTIISEEPGPRVRGITIEQMVARSVGHVRLRSADPTEAPHVAANLMGDDEDVEAMVSVIEQVVAVAEAMATDTTVREEICINTNTTMSETCSQLNPFHLPFDTTYPRPAGSNVHFARWIYPTRDMLFTNLTSPKDGFATTETFDRAKARAFVRKGHFQGWHPTSTAAMGPAHSRHAVLDASGRVYNVRGLRVVDASMLPVSPDVNTQAPVYIASTIVAQLTCEMLEAVHGLVPTIACRAPSAPDVVTTPLSTSTVGTATFEQLVDVLGATAVTMPATWGHIGHVHE